MEIGPAVGPSIVQEPQENRAHHSAIEGSAGQGLRRRGPRKPRPYRPSEEASVPFIVPPFDEEETFHHTTRSVPVPESAVPLQGEAADLPQSPDGSETSYSTPREETELDVVHSYPPPTYRNPNSSSPSLSSVTPPSPPTDPSSLRRATHRLRIFLAPTHIYKSDMEIRDEWDDADVLEHLNMVYRDMRSAVRRWLSAKKLRIVWQVEYYTELCGCKRVQSMEGYSVPEGMANPVPYKGSYVLKNLLVSLSTTCDPKCGLELVESWQILPLVIAYVIGILSITVFALVYSRTFDDYATGFTIAAYISSSIGIPLAIIPVAVAFRT
ncbi:hypothetical protein NEOLEDRAFT_1142705 [Neolentinus lepideus HHB14362 ss-1]|uniref:Uncharacterized protein n=1 Tax=Neolentinus lepideus HHB14362 ss-1 TaxID=1314782 RepID=A0A165MZU7_9AGAM|nr:hypothetical protein NEOLEDRAFT_1142705 [Neolentinus lepideus HHB14362 ss-1]